jgi:hypothetical protein
MATMEYPRVRRWSSDPDRLVEAWLCPVSQAGAKSLVERLNPPDLVPPKMRFRTTGYRGYYYWDKALMTLPPPSGLNVGLVLHELAHHVTRRRQPPETTWGIYGREFVAHLDELVGLWLLTRDEASADVLDRPGAPLSDVEGAAAAS